jgi:hypothetical protein
MAELFKISIVLAARSTVVESITRQMNIHVIASS